MNSLSNLGINFSVDYAKYNALKGNKGDYVDFMLHYDDEASQNGDESWMDSLFGGSDMLNSIPADVYSKLDSKTLQSIATSSVASVSNSFGAMDAQVGALKLQLVNAFEARYSNSNMDSALKVAKIADLYKQAESIALPTRFVS